jgi:protein-disulfide isomerase
MPTNSIRALTAVIILACMPLFSLAAVTPAPTPPLATDDVVAQKAAQLLQASTVIGNKNADVTIIEFFDYDCVYCKAVEPRLEQLLKSDKKVKLVLKEFPILTPESLMATRVALATVKQGKYAAFHQAMMRYEGVLDRRAIFDTAKSVGLNVTRLQKDMAAPEIADEIIANFNLARSLRLFQTPAFIINDHIVTGLSADINFPKLVAAARKK